MKKTHYAFLHPTNMYHSPYVLEYWAGKYGKEFFGNLCRATQDGEDVVATYKRMQSLTQEQFNDEQFEAARHFITWDLPRVEKVAKPYANKHVSVLEETGDGWYRVARSNCPQNYGYNGIQLQVPAGRKIKMQFKGIAGTEGFNAIKTDKAGWRYGFVAYTKEGRRVYGKIYREKEGKATFKVPRHTEYVWLVVSGAPVEHWPVVMGRQRSPADSSKEEQWPYQIKLMGTGLIQ